MVWKVARTGNRYSAGCRSMMAVEECNPLLRFVANLWPPERVAVFRAVAGCCRAASTHLILIAGEL